MTEQAIQKKIIDWLRQQGVWTVKIVLASRAGIPDIICCYRGRFIGLEVKMPGKKPTKLQEVVGEKIIEAGGMFSIVSSVLDVKSIIQEIDEQLRKAGGEAYRGEGLT